MLETWRISKCKDACCHCGRQLAPHRHFFSCLVEERSDLQRCDFCADCWEQDRPGELFCYWRTRRSSAPQKRVMNTEVLLEFFGRLDQPDSEQKRTFRFVLALYLTRRKELKLLEVARAEGGESLIFTRRSNGERVEVANPGLTEQQVQEVAGQLSQLLDAGL